MHSIAMWIASWFFQLVVVAKQTRSNIWTNCLSNRLGHSTTSSSFKTLGRLQCLTFCPKAFRCTLLYGGVVTFLDYKVSSFPYVWPIDKRLVVSRMTFRLVSGLVRYTVNQKGRGRLLSIVLYESNHIVFQAAWSHQWIDWNTSTIISRGFHLGVLEWLGYRVVSRVWSLFWLQRPIRPCKHNF